MKTKISVILLFISLALLIIYGADVLSAHFTSDDGAVILSIIAFAISLRERSTLVAVLLFINGGLIIAGMIGLVTQDGARESSTLYGTTGLGILLIALGIAKVFITRKK